MARNEKAHGAYMHGKYERPWSNGHVKVFATKDGCMD